MAVDPAGFVADVLLGLGQRIAKFSRKKTPREERAAALLWSKQHILLSDGSCVICSRPDVDATAECPGPLRDKK
jgi:hypothetical protein